MKTKISPVIIGSILLLSACAGGEAKYPTGFDRTTTHQDIYAKRDSIMGDHGFCFGGSDARKYQSEGAPQVFAKAKVSLATAIKNAEAATHGKAFDAEINRYNNDAVYIVKLLKHGKVVTVAVSAKTGAVLK